jgi:hypothetical protein
MTAPHRGLLPSQPSFSRSPQWHELLVNCAPQSAGVTTLHFFEFSVGPRDTCRANPSTPGPRPAGGRLRALPRRPCVLSSYELSALIRAGGNICYADTPEGRNREHAILHADRCVAVNPSDSAPAFIALDAKFVISTSKGERVANAEDYFIGPDIDITRLHILQPGDLLTAIRIPSTWAGARFYFEKVRGGIEWRDRANPHSGKRRRRSSSTLKSCRRRSSRQTTKRCNRRNGGETGRIGEECDRAAATRARTSGCDLEL